MQIQPQKFNQIFLTGVGLILFAVAFLLNHYHPHNQGVANLTRGALFKKLGISEAATSNSSGLYYVGFLPKKTTSTPTPKMDDPTQTPANQPDQAPALPVEAEANQDTAQNPDTNTTNQMPSDQSDKSSPAPKDKTAN
jgi:hypothetical protein